MEKIILVKPDLSYADEIQRYKKEFLEDEPIINGSAGLDRFSTVEDWLEELKKRSNKDTVPEGLVPSSTYLGIRKKDNYIVGMIDIRHSLNDFLLQVGGHIGCGVRKSERKKGYAKQMIKLALEKCKEIKIEEERFYYERKAPPSAWSLCKPRGVRQNQKERNIHKITEQCV